MAPRRSRMSHCEVKAWLRQEGVNFRKSFYVLAAHDVSLIVEGAKRTGYRKAKYAPGSTGRMYYQLLQRTRCGTPRTPDTRTRAITFD